MKKFPLAAPVLGPEEERAVAEVVASGWLTMGPKTSEFEAAFGQLAGAEHAVMVSSCTAALHVAFLALGIGEGDEVIVPSLTFVATANAVAYAGATPVFADIAGPEDPVIHPDTVRPLITSRTKAICTVHYAGYIRHIDGLRELCDAEGLKLVEDAAHAPGALAAGRPAGSLGDVGCFSFFSNKNLVTGEGGMITTDDEELAAAARLLRAHGMTATSWDKERGHATGYDVIARGYNYRPSELEAALGLVQLARLPEMTARRRELVGAYRASLRDHAVLTLPFAGLDDESACHVMPSLVAPETDRDALRASAAEAGVQTSVHYFPVHRFSIFGAQPQLPRTEDYSSREVTLPLTPQMTTDDVSEIARRLSE